ncbi:MAG TPA: biotin/lipoyl-containing protein [Solirubrobacterales bacterium]
MPDVLMPRLSDSMEERTILQWLKQVGEEVALGEELVEIETDKANMAYEADVAGTLTEILAPEGETLPIGSVIARIGEAEGGGAGTAEGRESSSAGPVAPATPTVLGASGSSAPREAPAATPPAQETSGPRVKASPLARRLARDRGLDLSSLQGSGPGGRIVKADVEGAAQGARSAGRSLRRLSHPHSAGRGGRVCGQGAFGGSPFCLSRFRGDREGDRHL